MSEEFDVEQFYKQCTRLWQDFASKPGVVGPSSNPKSIWTEKKRMLLGARATLNEVLEKLDDELKVEERRILIEWAEKL